MSNAQYRTKYLPIFQQLPTIRCNLHTQFITAAQNFICNKYLESNKYLIPYFKYLPFFQQTPTIRCHLHTRFFTANRNLPYITQLPIFIPRSYCTYSIIDSYHLAISNDYPKSNVTHIVLQKYYTYSMIDSCKKLCC